MHLKASERWNKKNPVKVYLSFDRFKKLQRECKTHKRYSNPHRVADMEIIPHPSKIFDIVSEPIPDLEGYTFE